MSWLLTLAVTVAACASQEVGEGVTGLVGGDEECCCIGMWDMLCVGEEVVVGGEEVVMGGEEVMMGGENTLWAGGDGCNPI